MTTTKFYNQLSQDAKDILVLLRKQYLTFNVNSFSIIDLPGDPKANLMKLYELQSRDFGNIKGSNFLINVERINQL